MIRNKNAGFANPEYMIALAVVGVILSVAVPTIARLRDRSRNLKALATLRSALSRHAAETKTKGPADLSDLTKDGKYLSEIPSVAPGGHHPRSAQAYPLGVSADAGGWAYSSARGSSTLSGVWINCSHTDNRGRAWNAY